MSRDFGAHKLQATAIWTCNGQELQSVQLHEVASTAAAIVVDASWPQEGLGCSEGKSITLQVRPLSLP
jgi:hypothetical protein